MMSDRRKVYVVAVRDDLIALDLSGLIQELDPGCEVIAARTCEEALAIVQDLPELHVVFAEAGTERVRRTRLGAAVRARKGRLVLLGNEAEEEWEAAPRLRRPWPVLLRPFSGDEVTAVLRDLGR